ncbi:hypothetical protein SPHINGOT1_80224 [Sphingomonas sp. T1]|nr:hypothetical protein SPHINGOT1_80224 [Sphingomonas sp. T1]
MFLLVITLAEVELRLYVKDR